MFNIKEIFQNFIQSLGIIKKRIFGLDYSWLYQGLMVSVNYILLHWWFLNKMKRVCEYLIFIGFQYSFFYSPHQIMNFWLILIQILYLCYMNDKFEIHNLYIVKIIEIFTLRFFNTVMSVINECLEKVFQDQYPESLSTECKCEWYPPRSHFIISNCR